MRCHQTGVAINRDPRDKHLYPAIIRQKLDPVEPGHGQVLKGRRFDFVRLIVELLVRLGDCGLRLVFLSR